MASEAMRARFQEEIERGSKLPTRASSTDKSQSRESGARRKPMKPGKGPKQVSESMKVLLAKWAGMKAMALYLLGPDAVCGICEQPLHNGDLIDADHIIPAGDGGPWTPDNAQLLCAGPGSCHARKHGEPEWSKSA